MVKSDNPAGRLFGVLDAVGKYHNANAPMKSVWGYVLSDADFHAPASTWRQYGALLGLVEEGRIWVEQSEVADKSIYLKPFDELARLFDNTNLEETCDTWKRKLDDTTMVALQFCSVYFSASKKEAEIDQQTLEELQSDVDELIKSAHSSGLPDNFRVMLIESLEEIRRAILEYRLRGAAGLRRAMESGLGGILRFSHEVPEDDSGNPEPIIERFLFLLNRLDSIASAALKLKQVAGPIAKFVLPGSSE